MSGGFADRRRLVRWWGWFALATTVLALLIACRYLSVADLDDSPVALAFRTVMLVAHFATLSCLLLCPALALIALQPRAWLTIPLCVACSAAFLVALLIDTQVYLLYRFHINPGVLNLLLGGAARETFVFSTTMYTQAVLLSAAVVSLLVLAALLSWRHVDRTAGRPAIARAVMFALVGSVVAFHTVHIWADARAHEPLLEQTDLLPLRYAATAKRSLRALGVHVATAPALSSRTQHDSSDLAYPLRPLECRPPRSAPNVIVILIDSWRFDAMDAQVAPNLAAFSRRAARFMDHHSGGNATRIGVFSLFYSIPGTYWHRMLAERQGPVFIDELLKQGYDVQVFRSAPLFSPEFDRTVFAGLGAVRLRSDGDDAPERDRDLTEDFLSFLASRADDSPFFALLFYDSPHKMEFPRGYPPVFQPSADEVNYLELDRTSDPRPLLNRYRNSVHYVDSLAGKVLDTLESRGLLQKSVVVVTGDHGQEFNDSGGNYWGHASNFTRYQTAVPLLIHAPALEPAVYKHRTTHFDVMPTLMRNYLGCNAPFFTYSVGHSLFERGGRETVLLSEYTDFAIKQHDRITIVRKQGLEMRDADYGRLATRIDPEAIQAVLEQKSRFYAKVRAPAE